MTEPNGSFPGLAPQAVAHSVPQAAPAPSALPPVDVSTSSDADGFDRERMMRLLDRLERDIAAVEAAMVQVELGDHEAFAATVAPLEPHLAD